MPVAIRKVCNHIILLKKNNAHFEKIECREMTYAPIIKKWM
jgi:hypothetical protein